MRKLISKLRKDNKGEVMIESTIIVLITIMVLIAMISIGFVFYQQAVVTSVANEMAVSVADAYKFSDRDSFTVHNITYDHVDKVKKYRTSFSILSMQNLYKAKAEDYVKERVALTSFGMNASTPKVDELKIVSNNVGRLRVELSISMECDVLFDEALVYFGIIDDKIKYSASATAECIDLTAYSGHVYFYKYIGNKMEEDGGAINDILGNVAKVINDAKDIASRFFS